MTGGRDRLFADARADIEHFSFDARVAAVFEDMIRRSVPGYGTAVAMTGVIAGIHAQPDSYCYDLGCSLGATTLAMRREIRAPGCRILAVDNSLPMLDRCRHNLEALSGVPVDLLCADIRDLQIANASFVAMNFTLQFVPLQERDGLLARIRDGLRPGGALVLSEKVIADNESDQALLTELHHAFKRANGYSELEISAKRTALEKVLLPETLEAQVARLHRTGFKQVLPWMQCLNFVSLLARA